MRTSSLNEKLIPTIVSLGIFVAAWYIGALVINNEILFPGPATTLQRLFVLVGRGRIFGPLAQTVLKALAGLGLSLIVAVILGFLMGVSKSLFKIFAPIVTIIQSIPIVSWLALAIFWWGVGFRSPMYIVFLTLFPILTINIAEGVRNVDSKLVEMARVFHFTRSQVVKDIYFASAIPFLLSAMRVGIGIMWKSVAVAEFMVGTTGLGRGIADAKASVDTQAVFAYTILLVLLGIISEKVLDILSKRVGRLT